MNADGMGRGGRGAAEPAVAGGMFAGGEGWVARHWRNRFREESPAPAGRAPAEPLAGQRPDRLRCGLLFRWWGSAWVTTRARPSLLLMALALTCGLLAEGSAADGSWRFDFGSGACAPGWVQVTAKDRYDPVRGWGFDLGCVPEDFAEEGPTDLLSDGVTSEQPFFFSVRVPEGNHRVVVTLGRFGAGSTNWIKAESRRLMVERVVTEPGRFVTVAFTVNVRTPRLPDGRLVRLKAREENVLHWDDKLTLEFSGVRPAVTSVEIEPDPSAPTIFLLGDSTVTDQPEEPWCSWGQILPRFFRCGVAVANHAESGESLTSSLRALRVEKVLSQLKAGDFVFLQYGHNDQKERGEGAGPHGNYRTNLIRVIEAVRVRGAEPVLVTSMERKAGVERPTLGEYPEAMRRVAREWDVPLVDLNRMSVVLYGALGPALDRAFVDGSHHTVYGAYLLARCVVAGIQERGLSVGRYLVLDLGAFDPAQPPGPDRLYVPPSPQRSERRPDGS